VAERIRQKLLGIYENRLTARDAESEEDAEILTGFKTMERMGRGRVEKTFRRLVLGLAVLLNGFTKFRCD
jgi:hypothetical protein